MKNRLTIRLTPNQMLVLEELKEALNCNISLLIRTIVGSWLTEYEEHIYKIIDGKVPFDKNWNINGIFNTDVENNDDE